MPDRHLPTRCSDTRRASQRRLAALGAVALALLQSTAGAQATASAGSPPALPASSAAAPAPAAPAAWRFELVELAFDAASAIPLDPHVEDRSRAQERIVEAALELDRPADALRYAEQIANWRRGTALAAVAFHQVERGRLEGTREMLAEALRAADAAEDWRRDRIRVRVARVEELLGNAATASELERGVVAAESGRVEAVRAAQATEADFEARMVAIDGALALGTFDPMRNALQAAVRLYDRFHGDPARRDRVEGKIRFALPEMPTRARIDVLEELAEVALRHGDLPGALRFAALAETAFDSTSWAAEPAVPLMGRLATLRARAGDADGARAMIERALSRYDAELETIANVFRAEALRPIAAAQAASGDASAALETYRRAVEAGVENPNSRPRALDLAATSTAMALSGTEPDEALRLRLREIRERLGPPW